MFRVAIGQGDPSAQVKCLKIALLMRAAAINSSPCLCNLLHCLRYQGYRQLAKPASDCEDSLVFIATVPKSTEMFSDQSIT